MIKRAKYLQSVIGYLVLRQYLATIDNGVLADCHIKHEYVIAAEDIFKPNVESFKGKITWTTQNLVEVEINQVDPAIM